MENEFSEVLTKREDGTYTRTLVDEKGEKRLPRTWQYMIPGRPITKKNSQLVVPYIQGGRARVSVRPSPQYLAYEKSAVAFLEPQTEKPIDFPVNLSCVYYMPTKGHVDLVNLVQATQDILRAAGIIADDWRDIAYSFDGSRVYYDKDNPRVEVLIAEEPYSSLWTVPEVFKVKPKRRKKSEEQNQFDKLAAEEGWSTDLEEENT